MQSRVLVSAVLTLLTVAAYAQPAALTLYVAPNGNDAWSGKLAAPNADRTDGPLATPVAAREALRALKAKGPLPGPVKVVLRGGLYCLRDTLVLTPEDSGTAAAPITYQSYPGEQATLSGGRVVGNWREVPAGNGPRRWETKLSEVQRGGWYFRQLFVQRKGEAFFTRRYRPTKGMLAVADLTWSPARKTIAHRAAQPDFVFFPGDLQSWANLDDVELVALHSWSASRLKIANLDLDKRIVTLTSVPTFRIGSWYKDERNPYYVENVKEELREPGQWYLDRPTGVLTYLPLPGETLENTTFVAPRLERLVTCAGDPNAPGLLSHLTFSGLAFAHSEWPLPREGYDTSQGQPTLSAAVEVTAAEGLRFERCLISQTGAYGISLGLGAQQCAVVGCLMYDLGGGGVKVGDSSMKQTLTYPVLPSGNMVEENTISDFGLMHYSANGIWCGIVRDTRIIHNEVRRGPYSGIAVGWNWSRTPTSCGGNVIEGNHVHHIMQLVQDGGGIYTLGHQPGTVIRGNLIHDSVPSRFACGPGTVGLYFDEGSSGFTVEDNIQYNIEYHPERINQNQNTAAEHTIGTNYLGIKPGEQGFPDAIAAQAGVEPAYRWPQADKLPVTPSPVYAMQWPQLPPPAVGFDLDFEEIPEGRVPRRFSVAGATATATVGVTAEGAKDGAHSLKFQDRKGLPKNFYPYLNHTGENIAQGQVELSFDVRQDPASPGRLWVELRDYDTGGTGEYFGGPSLGIMPDGSFQVAKQALVTVPLGQWAHVVVHFALGAGAAKVYEATVSLADGTTKTVQAPYLSEKFTRLTAMIMSADADADGVAYVDNLKLGVK